MSVRGAVLHLSDPNLALAAIFNRRAHLNFNQIQSVADINLMSGSNSLHTSFTGRYITDR